MAEKDLPSISRRVAVNKAFLEFLERPDARRLWKPKKLALELWHLTPALRERHSRWETFWSVYQRPIAHIIAGDYNKLDDGLLYVAFENFLRANAADQLPEGKQRPTPTVCNVAATLSAFFGMEVRAGAKYPIDSKPVRLRPMMVFELAPPPEQGSVFGACLLAYRPLAGCPEHYGAVLFDAKEADWRWNGFMLAGRQLAVLRSACNPRSHVLMTLHDEGERDRRAVREALGRPASAAMMTDFFDDPRIEPPCPIRLRTDETSIFMATKLLDMLDNS